MSKSSEVTKKRKKECFPSESTSHTQFFRKDKHENMYQRITREEYFGEGESISGTSDSFHCIHGPEGKQYSEKGLLKRNIMKELDPRHLDSKWNDECPPAHDWEMAKKLEFLVTDDSWPQQLERLHAHLKDFARTSKDGYKINVLDSLCVILNFLVETFPKEPILRDGLLLLLENIEKPIALNVGTDIVTYFDELTRYIGFLGIELMKANVIENIFYRFDPYFPERKLPAYDINPADPQDFNVKLGDSSVHMSTTLTLLLVLVKTLKQCTDENPKFVDSLPCPDSYALRCFAWAFRYECRARGHNHERITLTVITSALVKCFGSQLTAFDTNLMPDVMSLSVLTELPFKVGWLKTVNFNKSQIDVLFKKVLIYLSVHLLKVFPYNKFMVESQYWLLGLMYLLDPGLTYVRSRWSPALFAELRKTALQALVCALPLAPSSVAKDYGLIRRIMWYIEWYSASPYELPVLYWSLRLLQVATYHRGEPSRKDSIKDLFDTHGIIILMHLCETLIEHQLPPVEKSQVIIALTLRLLTSALEEGSVSLCSVYPDIKWPSSINSLTRKMMDIVLHSLDKNYIISDRWLIALLNFIWEGIIWKKQYRKTFIAHNGVYKLLDLITMTRAPVQCLALALTCDAARAGDAAGQLVSWRASLGASNTHPLLVKRGATIATLLAAVFRDECRKTGVQLNESGIIQDLDNPLRSIEVRNAMGSPDFRTGTHDRTPVCFAAADLAGSRMSKAFALLQMLSEDLNYRVQLMDEAYNLYKHIKLAPEDEAILVLCSHYLTVKLNEAWSEAEVQSRYFDPHDKDILDEFLHVNKGWAVEIKRQQEDIIETDRKKKHEEEYSLYGFLARVRLNIALDALREVRCVARAADRTRIAHAMLSDAVRAHHRRSALERELGAPVLRTYGPPLDDQNLTGQYVKVYSISSKPRQKPTKSSPTCSLSLYKP